VRRYYGKRRGFYFGGANICINRLLLQLLYSIINMANIATITNNNKPYNTNVGNGILVPHEV
jgi:hypothetical protein